MGRLREATGAVDAGRRTSPAGTSPGATSATTGERLVATLSRYVPPALAKQLVSFGIIGVLSTLAHAGLFIVLSGPLGTQAGNFVALLICAILNTAANRRFTFGVRGRDGLGHQHGQALVLFFITWGMTAGALALFHQVAPHASTIAQACVIVLANGLATLLRFSVLRRWVFRSA